MDFIYISNSYLWMSLAIPLLIVIVSKMIWPYKITWVEFMVCLLVTGLITTMTFGITSSVDVKDVNVLNGYVTGKSKEYTPYTTTYQCRCRATSYQCGKSRCSTTTCDTCYKHHDQWSWIVRSTVGSRTIARTENRYRSDPEEYTYFKKGMYMGRTESYTNYIKGSPESLFNDVGKGLNLKYPSKFTNFGHEINRVVVDKTKNVPSDALSRELNKFLSTAGAKYKVNVVVVYTSAPSGAGQQLKSNWLGGKKNDLVVVIGADTFGEYKWVYAFGHSKNYEVFNGTRNALMDSKPQSVEDITKVISEQIKENWKYKGVHEYDYIKYTIHPSILQMAIIILLSSLITCIGIFFAVTNQIENWRRR